MAGPWTNTRAGPPPGPSVGGRPGGRGRVHRRWRRSLWMVPCLAFGIFTWLSFLIVGLSARRREWVLAGAAYGAFSALFFFALGRAEVENDDTASALLGFGLLVAWIGGVFHALVVNRSYLLHREAAPGPARRRTGPLQRARRGGPAAVERR